MADTRQYPNPGDKELPEVNADDEGKVLAVVKGAWDKAGSQIELPVVTSEDNGKLLGVTGGKWDSVNAPTELPAVTNEDNGRILQVSSGAWTKQNMPTELPAVTATDNGKVLGVAEGAWVKIDAPSSSNRVIVTYTAGDPRPTASKSSIEILNDFNAGKDIYIDASNITGSVNGKTYEIHGDTKLHLLNIQNNTMGQYIEAYFGGYVYGVCADMSDYNYFLILTVGENKGIFFNHIDVTLAG